jgi:hypothetical protein
MQKSYSLFKKFKLKRTEFGFYPNTKRALVSLKVNELVNLSVLNMIFSPIISPILAIKFQRDIDMSGYLTSLNKKL